jgi:hypothetical protein
MHVVEKSKIENIIDPSTGKKTSRKTYLSIW